MLTGVAIADNFIRTGSMRRVLVVSGERISSISTNAARRITPECMDELASLTVGDAGAAVLVERSAAEPLAERDVPRPLRIGPWEFATFAQHCELCLGIPCPDAPGAIMVTDTRRLHEAAMLAAIPLLRRVLERAKLSLSDFALAIPHQTSERAIQAGQRVMEGAFGALPERVAVNVSKLGNTASTTHFAALYRDFCSGIFEAGEHLLLVAFASGIAVGAMALTTEPPGGLH
jgi:3-oxoacyl-[acyl-carrier-protein] synthase-3